MKRGEVYWANVAPRSGSEQQGMRPVILLSHDGFNNVTAWRSIIVIPVSTSERQAGRGPTAIALVAGEGGLAEASTVLCHQITTLDKSKLTTRIGVLSDKALARVEAGLCKAIGLELEIIEP